MAGDIRALTGIARVAPLGLVLGAALARAPARGTLLGATVFAVVVYAAVWLLGRPTAFEVHTGGLWIRWPLRSRRIAAGNIAGAEMLSREAFRRDFGRGGCGSARAGSGAASADSTRGKGSSTCTSRARIASSWCGSERAGRCS
jgi:hypothetical protein